MIGEMNMKTTKKEKSLPRVAIFAVSLHRYLHVLGEVNMKTAKKEKKRNVVDPKSSRVVTLLLLLLLYCPCVCVCHVLLLYCLSYGL